MKLQRVQYFLRNIFLDWPRTGRKDFMCWQLLWIFCFIGLSLQGLALSLLAPPTVHELEQYPLTFPFLTNVSYLVYFLLFGVFAMETLFLTFKQLKVMAGRLRDLNLSGWWIVLWILFLGLAHPKWLPTWAFFSICLVVSSLLSVWPGSSHENKYGPVDDRFWQCKWHAKFSLFLLVSFVSLSCFLYYLIPSSILSIRLTLFALFFMPH